MTYIGRYFVAKSGSEVLMILVSVDQLLSGSGKILLFIMC